MEATHAWQATLGQLQLDMPKAAFNTWVKDSELLTYEDGTFVIGVHNTYARDWLQDRLLNTTTRILTGIMNRSVEVKFIVWQNQYLESAESPALLENLDFSNPPNNPTVNHRYTFDNFVVGRNNRLAHAAGIAVTENPAKAYNPLFIYGGAGLGKTHLLHAIGNVCHNSGLRVLYVSSEEFTNDLIHAIRTHKTPTFRDKYRNIDVLMIDDIQFITGKESTQEEFFHTFNTLHGQDKQIVISSDRTPKSFKTLEERLRSRFEWGITVDLHPPEYETRMAILRSKTERLGQKIPDDILEKIAQRVVSNIRELEGALNRISIYSSLSKTPLSHETLETALRDLLPTQKDIDPAYLVKVVSEHFHIDEERLYTKERSSQVALPRQIAMYLLREDSNLSTPQIGKILGGRDHTTVLYGCGKITELLEVDEQLRHRVVEIREKLFGGEWVSQMAGTENH